MCHWNRNCTVTKGHACAAARTYSSDHNHRDEYNGHLNGYRGTTQPTYSSRPAQVPLPWEDHEPAPSLYTQPSSSYTRGQPLGTHPSSQGIYKADIREAAGRAAEKRRLEDLTRGKPKQRAREAARAARIARRNARHPGVGGRGPPLPAVPAKAPALETATPMDESTVHRHHAPPPRVLTMLHNADGNVGARAFPNPVPAKEPAAQTTPPLR